MVRLHTQDQTTRKLLNHGVYSLRSHSEDEEPEYSYDFSKGVGYIFLFLILLWWLPGVGQMLAGYIGGRKTGTGWKGVLAASIPVLLILLFLTGINYGILPFQMKDARSFLDGAGNSIASILTAAFPSVADALQFPIYYLTYLIHTVTEMLGLNMAASFLFLIVFGYLGGLAAERRELENAYIERRSSGKRFSRRAGASWGSKNEFIPYKNWKRKQVPSISAKSFSSVQGTQPKYSFSARPTAACSRTDDEMEREEEERVEKTRKPNHQHHKDVSDIKIVANDTPVQRSRDVCGKSNFMNGGLVERALKSYDMDGVKVYGRKNKECEMGKSVEAIKRWQRL